MGLFNKIFNQFIDVIEWVDNSNNSIIWKFPRYDNEIKMGAKLTVRESQMAVFMNEGKIADIFGPGMYQLSTQNMPVLTTLKSWKYGFNSPFKADVYFVSTRMFINQKWGTQNPVIIRDAEFGPVRLRAYGSYNFAVSDPKLFVTQISATNPDFQTEDVNGQLRNIAVSRGMDSIAESKISLLDLSSNYDEISKLITDKIQPDFAEMGLNLTKFLVENISLPPEVEQALDKRSEMGIVGNLGAYAQFQAANAIEKSAENSIGGNLGAAGMGLGVGAAMMGQVGNIFQPNQFNPVTTPPPAAPVAPPPVPQPVQYFVVLNGKSEGPFSTDELTAMAMNRTLTSGTLVWKKGMAGWEAANMVDDVASILSNVPPAVS
ncbi:MAG TPA: SPFH domain-containing protein [Mucilaginibacter sp.]|nr:SPFH domain-containing protein [Mucilaginibacter sp.]